MDFFGLFSWERKVRKIRKRWDRLREKTLKEKGALKAAALQKLDSINSSITMIEERNLSRVDRARLRKEIEISLEEAKAMLKYKEFESQQNKANK